MGDVVDLELRRFRAVEKPMTVDDVLWRLDVARDRLIGVIEARDLATAQALAGEAMGEIDDQPSSS
jgi:hypothetical protein